MLKLRTVYETTLIVLSLFITYLAFANDYTILLPEIITGLFHFLDTHWEATVALCALVLTIWTILMQRKHNKLSLRPLLSFAAEQDAQNNRVIIHHRLRNGGVGPAVIQDFEVYYKGALIDKNNYTKALPKMSEALGDFAEHCNTKFGCVRKNIFLAANEEKTIIYIDYPLDVYTHKHSFVTSLVEDFCFKIKYKSIYEESFLYIDAALKAKK